jgi:RsmE family RNA methyltransferase
LNLLLLDPGEIGTDGRARVGGRRLEHVRDVLGAKPGDTLLVGELDGRLGSACVRVLDAEALELEVQLDQEPPPALPVSLALALPRPPTLRKVLQQASAMGVKRLALFGAARVEKSFWNSSQLEPGAIDAQLRLGLEQARDTRLARVSLHPRFRPFVDETLPALVGDAALWLAEPGAPPPPAGPRKSAVLIFGPEGGLRDHEVSALRAAGALPVGLGTRPLRVETAVVALLGAIAAHG